jgi:hypothetical protein
MEMPSTITKLMVSAAIIAGMPPPRATPFSKGCIDILLNTKKITSFYSFETRKTAYEMLDDYERFWT